MMTLYPLMMQARNEGRSSNRRSGFNPFSFFLGFWSTGTKVS